jgi:hypothetical protein
MRYYCAIASPLLPRARFILTCSALDSLSLLCARFIVPALRFSLALLRARFVVLALKGRGFSRAAKVTTKTSGL